MAGRVVVSAAASVDRTLSVTNGNTPATMVIRIQRNPGYPKSQGIEKICPIIRISDKLK